MNFENFVIFTINIFGESEDVEDVPFQYSSAFSKNYTLDHFPSDMESDPIFEKEPVFKYEHNSIISPKETLTEENVEFLQKDLQNIVCTGQVGELPEILGKGVQKLKSLKF